MIPRPVHSLWWPANEPTQLLSPVTGQMRDSYEEAATSAITLPIGPTA